MYDLDSQNTLIKIFDSNTGKIAEFITSEINSDMQIKYRSDWTDLILKKKETSELFQFKLEWAQKIIIGIGGNYFRKNGKFITSDKSFTPELYEKKLAEYNTDETSNKPSFEQSIYDPDWFATIKRKRSDLLFKIVDHCFGETNFIIKEEQIPFGATSGH